MQKEQSLNAVSPPKGETAFLVVGKLQRPHGVRGEISMLVITDFPERLVKGKKVWIGEAHVPHTIKSSRWKADLMLLGFEGFEDRNNIEQFVNQYIYVNTKNLPKLPEGRYYQHQLIGLSVFEQDKFIGFLTEILSTGANDVFVVKDDGKPELLLPDIKDVILEIDLEKKLMRVFVPEGLRQE